tara:strand:+ start:7628 stop:8629 length:1002 start_codon:yes stop_codon:yes gene_type:complete
MQNHHKFKIGDKVSITLPSWKKHSYQPTKVDMECTIVDCVFNPFGYNVRSQEMIHFRGFIPEFQSEGSTTLNITDNFINIRNFFVLEPEIRMMQSPFKMKLKTFFSTLEFRRIDTIHCRPIGEIEYINYHSPEGKIITVTDDKPYLELKDSEKRLAYKIGHFFGFAAPLTTKDGRNMNENIHFTINRYGYIDLWYGLKWTSVDSTRAYRPSSGDIICGNVSINNNHNAASMDEWFITSPQFKLLCEVISDEQYLNNNSTTKSTVVESLIIPENDENYYVPYEPVLSRYIYAAIYLMSIHNEIPPAEWTLPLRKGIDGNMEPFHVWWPKEVIKS